MSHRGCLGSNQRREEGLRRAADETALWLRREEALAKRARDGFRVATAEAAHAREESFVRRPPQQNVVAM